MSLNNDGSIQTAAIKAAGGVTGVNNTTPDASGNVTLTATNIDAVSTSQVGSPSGVASLNGSGLIPSSQLGTNSANSTNYLRGDGTWNTPSGSSGALASDSDVTIGSPSNGQVLTYNSLATKWENEAPAVPSVFGRTGAVVAASGDYTAAEVGALTSTDDLSAIASANATAASWSNNGKAITGVSELTVSGLSGATAVSRYVGATASGAPTSGTFALGDFVIDQTGTIWICTVLGTPGTWVSLASLAGAVFAGYVAPAVVALTFASSITINAALGNVFAVTLTASTGTLANPTNATRDGQPIRVRIIQGTGGGFTLAYGSAWDFGAVSAPTLSTTAGAVDYIVGEYNAAKNKWCVSAALGY